AVAQRRGTNVAILTVAAIVVTGVAVRLVAVAVIGVERFATGVPELVGARILGGLRAAARQREQDTGRSDASRSTNHVRTLSRTTSRSSASEQRLVGQPLADEREVVRDK